MRWNLSRNIMKTNEHLPELTNSLFEGWYIKSSRHPSRPHMLLNLLTINYFKKYLQRFPNVWENTKRIWVITCVNKSFHLKLRVSTLKVIKSFQLENVSCDARATCRTYLADLVSVSLFPGRCSHWRYTVVTILINGIMTRISHEACSARFLAEKASKF